MKRQKNAWGEKKPRKGLSLIIMAVVVVFVLLTALTGFLTDWMWFRDLGYTKVFWTKLVTQLEIGGVVFLGALLLVRLYLTSLRKGYFREVESHEIPDLRKLNIISWVLAGLFALLVANFAARTLWKEFLAFAHSTPFGLKDPLFGIDISFYVFKLEFLTELNNLVLGIVIGAVIVTLVYYTILLTVRTPDIFEREEPFEEEPEADNSIPFRRKGEFVETLFGKFTGKGAGGEDAPAGSGKRRAHINNDNVSRLLDIASGKLTILGIVFYLMVGVDFFLKQFDLLHEHTGAVYGAGFTDVNITLWVYRLIMLLSLVGAFTLTLHMKKGAFRKMLRVPAAMVALFVLGTGVRLGVQQLVVSPDEISKEGKYLKNNIEYTRHAYGLDAVQVDAFSAEDTLTAADISANEPTFSNIRINDYEPVKDYYNQTQSIRQYYDFNDVDIDRYKISGEETQTYLSPREINEKKISDTWINKHLKYTHGYGVALSRVDAVTASGQPDVLVKNIPPESRVSEIAITRPEIYFGELTNNYIVVNTDEPEFDYPNGNSNKYAKYEGKAGIPLTPLNRLLFAMREGSMKLLVSSNVNSDSRIILNRNVIERVKTIMPYLSYEKDPYMTTVDGKLYWIVDAYTTSSYYPYSEPYSGEIGSTNYVRNSVKVVIDAYNGNVDYYIVDKEDPVAKTYAKIYPSLFKNLNEMPAGLREHIRYPNTLLKIQADVYTKYHMDEVKVFYQNEDLWDIAHQIYGTEDKEMEPSYFIFKLPGEDHAEFINMIPFTPKSKQNMTAIMMARNDGNEYGRLKVYKFPKNKTVYGPMQVEAQIDQSTEISKEFSLWNSSGSTYKRGDMFVIPVNHSILYVEPVYLESSNQAIPEVKRVIVAYGDRIAYEATLEDALISLFGEGSGGGGGAKASGSGSRDALIKDANAAYDRAVEAQKNGDWKAYGEALNELAGYLDDLESSQE